MLDFHFTLWIAVIFPECINNKSEVFTSIGKIQTQTSLIQDGGPLFCQMGGYSDEVVNMLKRNTLITTGALLFFLTCRGQMPSESELFNYKKKAL